MDHGTSNSAVSADVHGSGDPMASIRPELPASPPLVAAAGPFAGAVLRADGALRLVLDGPALAARARVLSQRHG